MKDRKSFFKEWLETLQQESWQLELLISGLALLGIFQSRDLIIHFGEFLSVNFFSGTLRFVLNVFHFILNGSWYIFVINLVIHIVLRGLWIGAIGLRYVSQDIDYSKLNLSEYFEKLFRKRYDSFDDFIEQLEAVCSVIFAWTFLLFFILLSASLSFLWLSVFNALLDSETAMLFSVVYVILGMIVLIDFVFINPLKKIKDKTISRFYGFIFRFYATITLSFLYRPLLLNFLDNRFTKRLFILSIPYGFVIILLIPRIEAESHAFFPSWGQSGTEFRAYNALSLNPYLYDNLEMSKKKKIEYVSLKSDRVESDVLQFFFAMRKPDQLYLKEVLGFENIRKTGLRARILSIGKNKDPGRDTIETEYASKVVELNDLRREQPDSISEKDWLLEREMIEADYQKELLKYHRGKLSQIRDSIIQLSDFYIDKQLVNDKLECLFSIHPNMNERGWNCYIKLDSLENGLHHLKIDRKYYVNLNGGFNVRPIEIPFILDKN